MSTSVLQCSTNTKFYEVFYKCREELNIQETHL